LHQDVFARGYLQHALDDSVAFDFWANHMCADKEPGKLLEPVSLGIFCSKLGAATGADAKVMTMAEACQKQLYFFFCFVWWVLTFSFAQEMFKNFLVYNGMVNVGDFGEMLLRFGKVRVFLQRKVRALVKHDKIQRCAFLPNGWTSSFRS